MLFASIFVLLLLTVVRSDENIWVCFNQTGQIDVSPSPCTFRDPLAHALFKDSINSTGWSTLEVSTRSPTKYEARFQAYAAGVAEGAATQDLIFWHYLNTVSGYCCQVRDYCWRLKEFLNKNLAWMRKLVLKHPDDPYWQQVGLILYQLAGISDGFYGSVKPDPHMNIDPFGFLMFQIAGDLGELEKALKKPKWARKSPMGSGSCSAFIRPLSGNRDLFFAHDTWNTYQSMLRVLKLYDFPWFQTLQNRKHKTRTSRKTISGQTMTFSSYPGALFSMDDFYLISSGLAVTETTIGNSNDELLKKINPSTLLTWVRVQVANRLASTTKQWTDIFARFNSGTYNNQWMVIDYKRFKPGKPLAKSGLFRVLEQLPGHTESADLSQFLRKQGYWPSYNIPYFPRIFNMSGSWANVEKYGDWWTYDKSPRALIFKRDWRSVLDMASLQKLMRYNNYKKDPLSRCNCTPPYSAENAISARCDLNPKNGSYPFPALGHRSHGGTDMKATNFNLVQRLRFVAISGPTYDQLPPFQWSTADFAKDTPHYYQPDKWQFKPITHRWTNRHASMKRHRHSLG